MLLFKQASESSSAFCKTQVTTFIHEVLGANVQRNECEWLRNVQFLHPRFFTAQNHPVSLHLCISSLSRRTTSCTRVRIWRQYQCPQLAHATGADIGVVPAHVPLQKFFKISEERYLTYPVKFPRISPCANDKSVSA